MKKVILFGLLFLLFFQVRAQETATLSGYIKDSQNGEELIGVTIYIPSLKAGTVTNGYGFYSLTVPKGTYEFQFSYVGFKTQQNTLELTNNLSLNVQMEDEAVVMQEIVIQDEAVDANVTDLQMSKNVLNLERVKKLPALFGEVDIIKNIQMLPGVITAGEGTSAFYVRGGGADQNLILIDEAPIYDPSHLGGLFSVFNADVIKDSELYKGGIPSRFGGRLSSILEVRTKDGNNKKFATSGGIGVLGGRLMVEGPLKKEKSSYIISARHSFSDVISALANQDNSIGFYDVNAKVNWRADNNNRFFVALYSGRDNLKFNKGEAGFSWGNNTGTFRWNHLFSDRLFLNTSVIASQFDYSLNIKDPALGITWNSGIQELSLKNDFTFYINTRNELSFGYQVTGRKFAPGKVTPNSSSSIFESMMLPHHYALDHGLYLSNQLRLSDNVTVDYGARLSVFQNVGQGDVYHYVDFQNSSNAERTDTVHYRSFETIKAFMNIEPRLAFRMVLSPEQSMKLSYNRMVQHTHLIATGTVPLPFNTWTPSGYYLKPQLADQFAVGYFRNLKDNMYEFSLEGYFKNMKNVTDFADNAQVFLNEDLATQFRQGISWAYGAEFMLNKKEGKLTGTVGYTWSKAMRKVSGVNSGLVFPANYDRRNVFNIQAAYDLNNKWSFGANYTYSTGRPITLPTGKFEYDQYHPDIVTERNGYRLPSYNRLDLSATLNPRKNLNRRWHGQWVFSVYNVYNRKNPFTIYTRTMQDDKGNVIDPNVKEARMVYLFPLMPFVTYNFKF